MRRVSTFSLLALAVLAMACHFPNLYDRVAVTWVEKTHLFYSPTLKDFIWTETTPGFDPEAAAKAEDHHANIAYKDAQGRYYERAEFERHLPFIYIRNMDRRGLLPLLIDGKEYDREAVDAHRQVLELSARNLPGHTPSQRFWPLLNNDPNQAGLVFPDDRFRMTGQAMEFINADYNQVDEGLTTMWTEALKSQGFVFPARLVAGNFTILKPFDGGVFIVDYEHHVFHLKREQNKPQVIKTPIDSGLESRYITVTESNLRQFHGLLLDGRGRLHLLTTDDYKLIELPAEGYDPETMDFKIIFDPIYKTLVYSDDKAVEAVALNADYLPIASYRHTMSKAVPGLAEKVRDFVFPFRLTLTSDNSRMVRPVIQLSPYFWPAFISTGLIAALVYAASVFIRHRRRVRFSSAAFVFMTGLYGLIAASMVLED